MVPWIKPRFADEVLKPGTTGFVCWNNYGRNTTTEDAFHADYWVGVICSETTIPAELKRARPPGGVIPSEDCEIEPKPRCEKLYPVFLPMKGRL
jgi:hypothetical protein